MRRALAAASMLLAGLAPGCAHSDRAPPTGRSVAAKTIELDLHGADLYDALRELSAKAGINLFLDPDLEGQVTLRARAMRWDEALASIAGAHQLRVEALNVRGVARPCFWVSKQSSPPAPRRDFTGVPITVRFDETPVRSAAQTLAETAGAAVIVDDGVDTRVTLHLRNIPWDLALYHLAQKYALRIVREGSAFRIVRQAR